MATVQASSNERDQVIADVAKHVALERVALENGDFRVLNAAKQCIYVVERKTLADFRASFLTNQHLQDQIARLYAESREQGHRFFLVVESKTVPSWSAKPAFDGRGRRQLSDKALLSCATKLQLAGVPVVFVASAQETGLFLAWLAKRVAEEAPEPASPVEVLGEAVPIARTARAKNASRHDVRVAMLQCIPGVSKKRAAAILAKRGSLRELCQRKLRVDEFAGEGVGKKTVATINEVLE